ncbi:MAG: ABC transporter substrate-binding protein [Chloroflexi bacterium]|nr:ABC transporter substrate-binding protein [Chloroflexota bacterium]
MPLLFIGLDDTDTLDSRGTGRLARHVAAHLEERGLGRSLGVSRHQLLVDPAIPYTSHNSSLCVALDTPAEREEILAASRRVMEDDFVPGADPGLCVARSDQVTSEVLSFGARAAQVLVTEDEAYGVAQRAGLLLVALGGTGLGVIGALAAVAQRAAGSEGRFVEVRGVRAVPASLSVAQLKQETDIADVRDPAGCSIGDGEMVETLGWIRPSLVHGAPVLLVEQHPERAGLWTPCLRRQHIGRHHDGG